MIAGIDSGEDALMKTQLLNPDTPEDDLAACGHCGWVGRPDQLRHPEEYLTESPSSYQGRDDELEGGREFCPHCDESAQTWDRYTFEEYSMDETTWEQFWKGMVA